ncbi:50S ribosome-binding GTPase [Candidatus Micrarchaeota archaeon]|nr:50S ribosome-binding GTPase [Candidatus Micrarchaeota archaeon]
MPLRRIINFFLGFFSSRKSFSLGIYGPVNAGKTSIANRICTDWTGQPLGSVSEIPHETREVKKKERVAINAGEKILTMNILDMPGIATKVDYREFIEHGLSKKESQQRAKEATRGIVEAIKWLEHVDAALVVMDATKDPYTQVNITILANLEAKNIPVIIVANKTDLKKARVDKIRDSFPQHEVVGVSALTGEHFDKLYKEIARKVT